MFQQLMLIALMMFSASQLSNPDICIKALKYSPLLGGFTAVLSNGKAAFITARSLKFEPNVSENDVVMSFNQVVYLSFYGLI